MGSVLLYVNERYKTEGESVTLHHGNGGSKTWGKRIRCCYVQKAHIARTKAFMRKH